MTATAPPAVFLDACSVRNLSFRKDQLTMLSLYLDMLMATNKQMNLTAVRDVNEAWMRHIYDSLLLVSHMPAKGRILDVGSGGGLPGIPLAICCPELSFTLLEATGKKACFLRKVQKVLSLENVDVVNDRAEMAGHKAIYREQYDFVLARAVAALRVLLEITIPFLKPQGILLAMKGKTAQRELAEAQHAMALLGVGSCRAHAWGNQGSVLLELQKTVQTDLAYPRKPGVPNKRPL